LQGRTSSLFAAMKKAKERLTPSTKLRISMGELGSIKRKMISVCCAAVNANCEFAQTKQHMTHCVTVTLNNKG